jgi:6-phosphogluconate dehydrogenase
MSENKFSAVKNKQACDIGIVGLGVMGRNLLLNMVDHGFSVIGYDNDPSQVNNLHEESEGRNDAHGTTDIKTFISHLRQPRAVMLLVPAGSIVDSVITDLLPHLQINDLIIDAGNSYFKDTDIRALHLMTKGIQFLGVGISGGEEGARHGPSIMPGGSKEAYERVRLIFESIAAKVNDDICVTYLGPRSVGHFVKMVHNGIEYGMMQLIAETYDLMKRGLNFNTDQLREVYAKWNHGELSSYLLEITSYIFDKIDEKTSKPLIDIISAVAKQHGTGMWTSQSAMKLQVPTPSIDLAVIMRDMSVLVQEREQASLIYQRSSSSFTSDPKLFLIELRSAFFAAMIITYAQGFAILATASKQYQYELDLEAVSRIWRGGCIIRAALLDDISSAFHENNKLPNLLLDPQLSRKLMAHHESLRKIVCQSIALGISTPGLMVSLSYFDAYRSVCFPANLIQAQRDYFGAHTYERIDTKGTFHTNWNENS